MFQAASERPFFRKTGHAAFRSTGKIGDSTVSRLDPSDPNAAWNFGMFQIRTKRD
jgi:hypothetical protein